MGRKQIIVLILKIFVFFKIIFFVVVQEKLVLQITAIEIIKFSWISLCRSATMESVLLLRGKSVGGSFFGKEKLVFFAEANCGAGAAQQKSDEVGNEVLFPLHP